MTAGLRICNERGGEGKFLLLQTGKRALCVFSLEHTSVFSNRKLVVVKSH